jgi:hypothetical protein
VRAYWFDAAALDEFKRSVIFYESCQPGLGVRFFGVVEEGIFRIRANPLRFPPLEGNLRKCKLKRFPYGIIFRETGGRIEIIAVMHLRREPNYWKGRFSAP